jgi:hypothetical protein
MPQSDMLLQAIGIPYESNANCLFFSIVASIASRDQTSPASFGFPTLSITGFDHDLFGRLETLQEDV